MDNNSRAWIAGQPSPYEGRDLTHFPDWHNLTVWDAFFNNLTSGLAIVAVLAWASGTQAFAILMPVALTAALILVLVDLAVLIFDLADPIRFSHSLRIMHFTSPLSVGVWGLVSYSIFLALAVVFNWLLFISILDNGGGSGAFFLVALARLSTIMAVIGAVVVICYKGVVFSCSSQPGLKEARWLTPFMVSDSLLMGLSLYAALAMMFVGNDAAIVLIVPFITLVIARCVTFALLWQNVKKRARLIYAMENNVISLAVYCFAGIIAIVLAFCGAFAFIIAIFLVLACGVLERYWLIGLPRPLKGHAE